jgi:hypothetical protein
VSRKTKKTWYRSGISLTETMHAVAILSITLIGVSGYRYCSTLDTRKADAYIGSARIGYLLSESWRGMQGYEAYDPVARLGTGMTIAANEGPDAPASYTVLGNYKIVLNDITFYATLSWKDISSTLKALNTTIVWSQRTHEQTDLNDADKSFELTTYVLI